MELRLTCRCGRAFSLTEGWADVEIACSCGRTMRVPPFRRRHAAIAQQRPAAACVADFPVPSPLTIIGIAAPLGLLLGSLFRFTPEDFALLGCLVALLGEIWLVVLMVRECHPEALACVVLIPFFSWYFAYQRWDVAKWAALCHVGGLLLLVFASLSGA